MNNILITDNHSPSTRFILEILAKKALTATVADNKSLPELLSKNTYDLVFLTTPIDNPVGDLDLVTKITAACPECQIIMIGFGKPQNPNHLLELAVKAIRLGCRDFFCQPLEIQKIENILQPFLPHQSISNFDTSDKIDLVGKSPKLMQSINMAKKIAPVCAPVLITGQSGTGKELIAMFIHQYSKRANGPYIRVNCAALSDSLLESELFGHEKGAFTGAISKRIGRFESAHCGTLLLDEITETPLKFQAKLLRVLEQQQFERLGSSDCLSVNVRIISTTNRDLRQEVENGNFRSDLYYRLSSLRLQVPPLSKRTEDLPSLVWHFVKIFAAQTQRNITALDPAMMDIFADYHWPGNIRQLRNVVLTSLVLGSGPTLSLADVSWLFDELQPLQQQNTIENSVTSMTGLPLDEVEKHVILETLDQTQGNQTKAAKILGISDRTLRGKIRRYKQQDTLQPA